MEKEVTERLRTGFDESRLVAGTEEKNAVDAAPGAGPGAPQPDASDEKELFARSEEKGELLEPERQLSLVQSAGIKQRRASPSHRSVNRAEVLLQYGNLQNEIMKFNRTLMLNRKHGADVSLLLIILLMSPFVISEWSYCVLKVVNPDVLVSMGQWLAGFFHRSGLTTDEQFMSLVRSVWDFCGGSLACFVLLFIFIIHSMRSMQSGWFSPTHLGIGLEGVRMHWNYPFWSYTGNLWRWENIRSVTLRKRKNKDGQLFKSLELRECNGGRRRLDLRRFRREQDRELLARALKNFMPQAQEAFEVREVMLLDDCDPSYTKLWTQSLLTPPARERLASLESGAELAEGRFIVEKRIGGGGQGTAYLAEAHIDEAFKQTVRQVVLKEYVLPDPKNMFDRRRALKKLEHEVALLGRLEHPGIARFIDVFVEDHRAYLVTEYVDGSSLRRLVGESGPLDHRKAAELAISMCDILTYLHGLEPPVVHQDFTPENILLSGQGDLKLVDFNVAKETITIKTGLVVGKQSYMPPEQFKGKACPASDVYALGGTLNFLLTGIDPEPLSAARPAKIKDSVPEALDAIVYRATALDLDTRYKSAAEMKEDLRRYLGQCEVVEGAEEEALT